jgi:hypothetical protein
VFHVRTKLLGKLAIHMPTSKQRSEPETDGLQHAHVTLSQSRVLDDE